MDGQGKIDDRMFITPEKLWVSYCMSNWTIQLHRKFSYNDRLLSLMTVYFFRWPCASKNDRLFLQMAMRFKNDRLFCQRTVNFREWQMIYYGTWLLTFQNDRLLSLITFIFANIYRARCYTHRNIWFQAYSELQGTTDRSDRSGPRHQFFVGSGPIVSGPWIPGELCFHNLRW